MVCDPCETEMIIQTKTQNWEEWIVLSGVSFSKTNGNNINLNNNILELKSNEKNLESNLKQSIGGFNSLYDKHKSLKLNFNVLEEDKLYKQKKINETSKLRQKLENKIKN